MLDLAWGLTDTCVGRVFRRGLHQMKRSKLYMDVRTLLCVPTHQQVPAGVPDQGDAAAGGGHGDHPGGDQQHAGGPTGAGTGTGGGRQVKDFALNGFNVIE